MIIYLSLFATKTAETIESRNDLRLKTFVSVKKLVEKSKIWLTHFQNFSWGIGDWEIRELCRVLRLH